MMSNVLPRLPVNDPGDEAFRYAVFSGERSVPTFTSGVPAPDFTHNICGQFGLWASLAKHMTSFRHGVRNIVQIRPCEQVCWVYAFWIIAFVAYEHPVRYFTYKKFITNSCSGDVVISTPDYRTPIVALRPSPQYAPRRRDAANLLKEPLLGATSAISGAYRGTESFFEISNCKLFPAQLTFTGRTNAFDVCHTHTPEVMIGYYTKTNGVLFGYDGGRREPWGP
jgi:hypothetical protein